LLSRLSTTWATPPTSDIILIVTTKTKKCCHQIISLSTLLLSILTVIKVTKPVFHTQKYASFAQSVKYFWVLLLFLHQLPLFKKIEEKDTSSHFYGFQICLLMACGQIFSMLSSTEVNP
jgi:hypothetical protein